MNPVRALHNKAMEFADQAIYARHNGDLAAFDIFSRQAFELEVQAAKAVEDDLTAEPTRSVLHRSAATLAYDCGEYREAERLIAVGLAGNPPYEIAQELRELQLQVEASLATRNANS